MADAPPAANRTAQVARAGGIMFASILLSRILGMARGSVMNAQFGFGLETDAYVIAARIPDTIFMLIAGGGLSSAFIPVFSELIHKGKEREAWRTFSAVVTLCALVAIVLVGVAWGLAPWIVGFFQGKKPDAVLEPAIHASRIMLPAQFAFLVGSVLLATLYARKRFAAPGLAPNVYNVGIILAALILPAYFHLGIESMAWGALVGAMVGNLVLPALAMMRVGSHFRPSLDIHEEGVRKFFRLLLPVILGFSLPSMVTIIVQKFAGYYGGDGVNTVLDASNNLMQAPLGFFGQALALAIFPALAEFVAKDQMKEYRDAVSRTLRTVVFLGMMSGGLMFALAPQIAHLLYGWGKARNDVAALGGIADCMRIFSFAIFAWCMQPVLMRGFFSLHKTLKPVAISTGITVLFVLLCTLAVNVSPDYRSLVWAMNVAALVLAAVLFFALESDVGALDRRAVGLTIAKSALAAVAGGLVAYLGGRLMPVGRSHLLDALSLLFLGLVGFWTFFFVSRALKMPETATLDRVLNRFKRD